MMTISRRMLGASAFALLFAASPAAAQTPETFACAAPLEDVDGPILNVKTRDGTMLKLKLAEKARPRRRQGVARRHQGGVISRHNQRGTAHASQKRCSRDIPEALRGVGEGSFRGTSSPTAG